MPSWEPMVEKEHESEVRRIRSDDTAGGAEEPPGIGTQDRPTGDLSRSITAAWNAPFRDTEPASICGTSRRRGGTA